MKFNSFWPYIVIIIVSILLFSGIMKEYAYTDVYEFLYNARNDNFIDVFIQGGRPVYGLFNKVLLTSITKVQELAWLRLLGVVGVILSTSFFFHLLHASGIYKGLALQCSLFFMFSPSASTTGSWMASYQVGWGLLMALSAGYFVTKSLGSERTKGMLLGGLGVIFGILALLTYQPTYTAFIIPGFLCFLKNRDIRGTSRFLGIYFLLYIVYFVLHKGLLIITELPSLSRASFTDNPMGKLKWFAEWPLKMVLQDNLIFYPEWCQLLVVGITVALAVSFLFILVYQKPVRVMALMVFFLTAFLFAAYIPNLVSSDDWVSYRTLSTLFMLKWAFIFWGLSHFSHRFRFIWMATIVIGLWFFLNSWYNINSGFIEIQTEEYRKIQKEVVRLKPEMEQTGQLVFIMPSYDFMARQGVVSRVVSDEFGSLSTSRDWVPVPMVKQILREIEGESETRLKVHLISDSEEASLKDYEGVPVINVEQLFLR